MTNRGGRPAKTEDERCDVRVEAYLRQDQRDWLLDEYPDARSPGERIRRLIDDARKRGTRILDAEIQRRQTELQLLLAEKRSKDEEAREAAMQAEQEERTIADREEAARLLAKQRASLGGKITNWVNTVWADPGADPTHLPEQLGIDDPSEAKQIVDAAARALERRRSHPLE